MKKPSEEPKVLADVIAEYYRGEWGFTGTRAGMRAFQLAIVHRIMRQGQPIVFRHGGAYGADFEAHAIWREECKDSAANVWPSDPKRAEVFASQAHVRVEPVAPAAICMGEIVKRSKLLLAAPHSEQEEKKSGTWDMIREALSVNKPTLIIWPQSKRLTLYLERKLHRVIYEQR